MMNDGDGLERRRTLRLLRLWREYAGGAGVAPLKALGAAQAGDVWPYTFTLFLPPDGHDPIVARCGGAFRDPPPAIAEYSALSALPPDCLLARASAPWRDAMDRGEPVTGGGGFAPGKRREIWWRSVILPMSADGRRVDHFLGAATARYDRR